jgi:hypothetical protein
MHGQCGTDRTPYVAWHLDPLPPGSKNEVQIDIGKERAAREHMLEAAGWISSPSTLTQGFRQDARDRASLRMAVGRSEARLLSEGDVQSEVFGRKYV